MASEPATRQDAAAGAMAVAIIVLVSLLIWQAML
jgi:hypothetical protein